MLPFLLFILGIFFLHKNNYAAVISIIIVLASTYLQMPVKAGDAFFRPSSYNVSDIGLALYVLFYIKTASTFGARYSGRLQTPVSVFFFFIIVNGIYDVSQGTSISDVLKYCRVWSYLTIVYIHSFIPRDYVLKSFKHIYYLTIILCVLTSIVIISGANIPIFRTLDGRGIKPPSYSMVFAVAAVTNFFNLNRKTAFLHGFLLFLPIVLNLKMTYAGTCVLMFVIYYLSKSDIHLYKKIIIMLGLELSACIFLLINTSFRERLQFSFNQLEYIQSDTEEDDANFAYRILHAQERYQYISKDLLTYVRGIGYIQENHLKHNLFIIGTGTGEVGVVKQLDTGDIAWSLFFVRLGMLGILIYTVMYVSIINAYRKHKYSSQHYFIFAYMVSFYIFCSLGNTIIAYSDFFIYPYLLLSSKKFR